MKKVFLVCSLVALVICQEDEIAKGIKDTRYPRNTWKFSSTETTDRNLDSYGAYDRCGEGKDKGVHACVPYYNCNADTYTIIKTERSGIKFSLRLSSVRFGTTDCSHFLDVCCAIPTNETTQTSSDPEVTSSIPPGTPKRCGIRNSAGIDFKLVENTNDEAEFGEFPWMVVILRTKYDVANKETLEVCGGSLITPNVVMTGAHCVQKFKTDDIKVRAGEWDTQTTMERLPYQERAVAEIIIHHKFHPQTLYNDVALLILEQKFDEAENVGTICLPPQDLKFESKNCFAMGWGENVFGKAQSVILKKIEMPIVQPDKCQEALRSTRLGELFDLHSTFICAGGEGKRDTCKGDGGSPLVCPDPKNPGRYLQAGIVAWGIQCGIPNVPGVYADVAQYRDWIDAAMKQHKIDTKPYIE